MTETPRWRGMDDAPHDRDVLLDVSYWYPDDPAVTECYLVGRWDGAGGLWDCGEENRRTDQVVAWMDFPHTELRRDGTLPTSSMSSPAEEHVRALLKNPTAVLVNWLRGDVALDSVIDRLRSEGRIPERGSARGLDWGDFEGIRINAEWDPDDQDLVYTALNVYEGEGDMDDDAREQIIERLLAAWRRERDFVYRLVENAFSWAVEDCNYLNPKYVDRLVAATQAGMKPEQAAVWRADAPETSARKARLSVVPPAEEPRDDPGYHDGVISKADDLRTPRSEAAGETVLGRLEAAIDKNVALDVAGMSPEMRDRYRDELARASASADADQTETDHV